MRRSHPLFSLTSISLTLILLAGLALVMWRGGNLIFNPGQVSAKQLSGVSLAGFASHAEFESECALCHAPFSTTQDRLCLDCHTQVGNEISRQEGVHARIDQVNQCFRCHSEHQGRQFDPGAAARLKFDHTKADFSLVKHQVDYAVVPLDCMECHEDTPGFTALPENCIVCHAGHNQPFMLQHITDFGENCLGCHDGIDSMSAFVHDSATFPLIGQHVNLSCADCHADYRLGSGKQAESISFTTEIFRNTSVECAACHSEPEIHMGMFPSDCLECHDQEGWSPAFLDGKPFKHDQQARFSLNRHVKDYQGDPVVCQDCHTGDFETSFEVQGCIDCHIAGDDPAAGAGTDFMAGHLEQFGAGCLDCHDGVDRLSNFDHAQVFPLEGVHASIDCAACHQKQVFSGTPSECVNCHAEPEIHVGSFGLQCQYCHTVEAWTPANLRFHNFPLDHGDGGEVACATCHLDSYATYTCYGCHEHQPESILDEHREEGIDLRKLEACTDCHPDGREE